MARRAKKSFSPIHIISIIAIVGVVGLGGFMLATGGGKSGGKPFQGVVELDVRDYLENSNALSNSTFRIEGVIGERLDNWRSSEGRLFSVIAEQGNDSTPVPVLVPEKFNSTNIQRHQRFVFKVTVQAVTGVLEVVDLTKA